MKIYLIIEHRDIGVNSEGLFYWRLKLGGMRNSCQDERSSHGRGCRLGLPSVVVGTAHHSCFISKWGHYLRLVHTHISA